MATKVIFKRERNNEGVYALFPEIDEGINTILCYQHMGQHSAAHKNFLKARNATKEEYQNLLNELVRIGYDDLEVLNEGSK